MAAFAFEGANLTWQRVKEFLVGVGASQAAQKIFLWSIKQFVAEQKYNPKLQFLSFADADVTTAGGILLATGVAKLLACYVIKTGAHLGPSGLTTNGTSTVSYLKLYDDATDDTTAAHERVALPLLAAGDESIFVYPQPSKAGTALANGLVAGADTTIAGTTDSSAGDVGPGFVLVSA